MPIVTLEWDIKTVNYATEKAVMQYRIHEKGVVCSQMCITQTADTCVIESCCYMQRFDM